MHRCTHRACFCILLRWFSISIFWPLHSRFLQHLVLYTAPTNFSVKRAQCVKKKARSGDRFLKTYFTLSATIWLCEFSKFETVCFSCRAALVAGMPLCTLPVGGGSWGAGAAHPVQGAVEQAPWPRHESLLERDQTQIPQHQVYHIFCSSFYYISLLLCSMSSGDY